MSPEVRQRGCAPRGVHLFEARDDEPRQHVRVRELGHAQGFVKVPGVVLELEQAAEAAQSLGEGDAGRAGDVLAAGEIRPFAHHSREHRERPDDFQALLGRRETADDVLRGEHGEQPAARRLVDECEGRAARAEARADLLRLESDHVGGGAHRRAPNVFHRLVQHTRARLARGVPVQHGRTSDSEHGLEPVPLVLDRLLGGGHVGPSSR